MGSHRSTPEITEESASPLPLTPHKEALSPHALVVRPPPSLYGREASYENKEQGKQAPVCGACVHTSACIRSESVLFPAALLAQVSHCVATQPVCPAGLLPLLPSAETQVGHHPSQRSCALWGSEWPCLSSLGLLLCHAVLLLACKHCDCPAISSALLCVSNSLTI